MHLLKSPDMTALSVEYYTSISQCIALDLTFHFDGIHMENLVMNKIALMLAIGVGNTRYVMICLL